MCRTGSRMYHRYYKLEFAFRRITYQTRPRTIDPAKLELQAKVAELRLQGWSFPTIARRLNISLGTAWNLAKKKLEAFEFCTVFILKWQDGFVCFIPDLFF